MLPIFDIPEHVVAGVGRDNLMGKIRNDVAKCSERVGNQEMSHKRKFELYVAKGSTRIWTAADKFRKTDLKENSEKLWPMRYVKMFLEVLRASFDVVVIDLNPNADAMNREFCLHSDCILVPTFPFLPTKSFKKLIHRVTIDWPKIAKARNIPLYGFSLSFFFIELTVLTM